MQGVIKTRRTNPLNSYLSNPHISDMVQFLIMQFSSLPVLSLPFS